MDFESFWVLYPRKVCKKPARMVWERMTDEDRAKAIETIPAHIKAWEARQTETEFIPHARTWLYQERWEDEIEIPKTKEPDWWTSEQGIMRKAQEVGIVPRPGESWFEVKGRINEKIRQAA